jgi:hypothetical protein
MPLLCGPVEEIDPPLDALIDRACAEANGVEVFISDPLVTPRRLTHHLIVCGNCAGDERLPRKTFLSADSTCASCGSRSYVLASKLQIPKKGKELDEHETA